MRKMKPTLIEEIKRVEQKFILDTFKIPTHIIIPINKKEDLEKEMSEHAGYLEFMGNEGKDKDTIFGMKIVWVTHCWEMICFSTNNKEISAGINANCNGGSIIDTIKKIQQEMEQIEAKINATNKKIQHLFKEIKKRQLQEPGLFPPEILGKIIWEK